MDLNLAYITGSPRSKKRKGKMEESLPREPKSLCEKVAHLEEH